jgi:hypothetical protein
MNAAVRSILRIVLILPLVATLSGCAQESDLPSQVHTLRVLAVRAETPFAMPGSTVQLGMLAYDGSPKAKLADGSNRPTSTLWIGGCNNPPGDNYGACVPYLHEVIDQLGEANLANRTIPANAPPGFIAWGPNFEAQIPPDIISSRPLAQGVVYPYGVQMVFFVHCGGQLRRVSHDPTTFPLGCFDSATGEQLGRDDFEFGYYPIFSYESIQNQNPVLSSITFAGNELGTSCSADMPCASGSHCGSDALCIPTVKRCTESDKDNCEKHDLSVQVPRSSVERAVLAHVTEADALLETVWVSYYANAGSFENGARIINDPHSGWSDDTAGKWRANTDANREVRLWAVVRDNRNGVAWAWRDVWVE